MDQVLVILRILFKNFGMHYEMTTLKSTILQFTIKKDFSLSFLIIPKLTYIIIPPNTAHTLKIKLDENPFGKIRFFVE